jgi:hypothetical protein
MFIFHKSVESSSELNAEPSQDSDTFVLSDYLADSGLGVCDKCTQLVLPVYAAKNFIFFEIGKNLRENFQQCLL